MHTLLTQVAATIRKYDLLRPGVTVIGVSGGVDSLVLLHGLVTLRDKLGLSLHVATLDHGLRGEAGRADAEFVRQTAEAWGVPVTVGSADVLRLSQTWHIGIEAAARYARYRFFGEVVAATNAVQLAVGHQQDDQVETILMHLLRGAGAAGLGGMRYVAERDGLRIVRPLLDIPRTAIERYAQAQGLHPRQDATNTDTTYTRNAIRLETIPLLRARLANLEPNLLRTANILRADDEAMRWALKQALPEWPERGAELALFKRLPLGLRRLALRLIDDRLTFEYTDRLAESLSESFPGMQIPLDADRILSIDWHGVITVVPMHMVEGYGFNPAALPFPILQADQSLSLQCPGDYVFPGGWQLTIAPYEPIESTAVPTWDDPLAGVLYIPPGASISVRTRQAGDRFTPLGLGGHQQKLSDTLINLKVPSRWRDRLPLLTIDGAIAWFVAPTLSGLRAQVANQFAWQADRSPLWTVRYNRPQPEDTQTP